ncbi:MAG: major capsid protein [Pseudomonadota bacterium]
MATIAEAKAVSLIEYGKGYEEGSLERAFIETFAATSDVMGALMIKGADRGEYKFRRTAELPTVKFRGFNEAGNESTGKTTIHAEGTFLMDEYIKVDRAEIDRLGEGERMKQERLKIIAMSRHWTDTFLKGDNQSDQREPNGLQNRFTVADTTLFHNSTASGGGALSLEKLDVAMTAVNGVTHLICSRDLLPYWMKAARDPNLTNSTIVLDKTDPLGRVNLRGEPMPYIEYNGVPLLFGYEPDDGGVILPFTEVGTGGGAAQTSSIYPVAMSDERTFGIESTALQVRDEGQLQGSPFVSTHVKWDWGLVNEHPRSGARLTSITKAAFVA